MLEEVKSLPGSKYGAAGCDRDAQLGMGEHGAEMGRHVVGTFVVMDISRAFGGETLEVGQDILSHRRIGILLDG